jgi:hypothetical protein
MMELHAIQGKKVTHVLTTHRGQADETPLQMISDARLEYFLTLERTLLAFIESVVSVLPPSSPPELPTAPAASTGAPSETGRS